MRVFVGIAFGVVLVVFASCCIPRRPTGEVYVSLVSVIDWETYGSRFQPAFQLTETEALTRAVADTAQIEQSTLDSFLAAVRLKSAASALEGAGTLESVTPNALPEPGAVTPFTDAEKVLDAARLAVDPRLQYVLATALWQEVQVLNHYVANATVVAPEGEQYAPYLLRFQVTGLPATLRSSYVTEVTLTLSPSQQMAAPVILTPLLINDHIEAALASRRDEDVRRMALSLAALFKGIGVGVDLDSFHQEVNRVLAREYNSLLTVTPVEPSKLVARIGARRLQDNEYVATAEPRFVTVLALVPFHKRGDFTLENREMTLADGVQKVRPAVAAEKKDRITLDVSYEASFIDPVSGSELQPAGPGFRGQFPIPLSRRATQWIGEQQTALAYDDGKETIVTLNDATGFRSDDVRATWFFKDGNDDDSPIHSLTAGETTYSGLDRQLRFSFPSLARMGIEPRAAGVTPDVAAFAMDTDPSDGVISARDATPDRTFVLQLLEATRKRENIQEHVHLFYPWVYRAQDKAGPKPGFLLEHDRTLTIDQTGRATLTLFIKLPEDEQKQPVKGFKIALSDPATPSRSYPDGAVAPTGQPTRELAVAASGVLVLDFANLQPAHKVKLTVMGPKGYATPKPSEVEVVAPRS